MVNCSRMLISRTVFRRSIRFALSDASSTRCWSRSIASSPRSTLTAEGLRSRPVGTDLLPQVKHIVVLMMENHSFDNYLGMLGRGDGFVVPAFAVDRVDAEELEVAVFELVLEGADHVAIFKLVEAAAGCGEDDGGIACVPEDEQFHIAPEGG